MHGACHRVERNRQALQSCPPPNLWAVTVCTSDCLSFPTLPCAWSKAAAKDSTHPADAAAIPLWNSPCPSLQKDKEKILGKKVLPRAFSARTFHLVWISSEKSNQEPAQCSWQMLVSIQSQKAAWIGFPAYHGHLGTDCLALCCGQRDHRQRMSLDWDSPDRNSPRCLFRTASYSHWKVCLKTILVAHNVCQ